MMNGNFDSSELNFVLYYICTGCQLSSGTRLLPYFSRTALLSMDCYTSFERYIPMLQNDVLFVSKDSLAYAQQLIL